MTYSCQLVQEMVFENKLAKLVTFHPNFRLSRSDILKSQMV